MKNHLEQLRKQKKLSQEEFGKLMAGITGVCSAQVLEDKEMIDRVVEEEWQREEGWL